jgi:hypothetical protein
MFKPVKVRALSADGKRRITSLAEATEFILLEWPLDENLLLEEARQACLDAISGKVPVAFARAAFVAAAKQSGIYLGRSKLKTLMELVAKTEGAVQGEEELSPGWAGVVPWWKTPNSNNVTGALFAGMEVRFCLRSLWNAPVDIIETHGPV